MTHLFRAGRGLAASICVIAGSAGMPRLSAKSINSRSTASFRSSPCSAAAALNLASAKGETKNWTAFFPTRFFVCGLLDTKQVFQQLCGKSIDSSPQHAYHAFS